MNCGTENSDNVTHS